jgi:UDP-N-acetyl-D-mannosaminuronic acid dehydrogenase
MSPIGGDEPGLSELIGKVVKKGEFRVTDDISVYGKADAILITVQTPVDVFHKPSYDSLRSVCFDIGDNMNPGTLVSLESTVAPGTTKYFVKPILEARSGLYAGEDFNLVYSYERVMVGRLLHNLINYPRIVGGFTPNCTERGMDLYKLITSSELYPTDCLTAEVAKVTENTYRDVNIAFANEVALICESLGVDVYEVRRFVNSLPFDPSNPLTNPYRNMHFPGGGVGGHCLPKDPWLLKYGLDTYGKKKVEPRVIVSSRLLNDKMPEHMKNLIEDALKERGMELNYAKIGILGFAYIENSDDPRHTPSLSLYNMLKDSCMEVMVHDPHIHEFEGVKITGDIRRAVKGKHCLVLMTRHREYLGLKPEWIKKLMETPVVIDGRHAFDKESFKKEGFSFRGVGIPLG